LKYISSAIIIELYFEGFSTIDEKEHVQEFLRGIGFSIVRKQLGLKPYELVKIGLSRLPFNSN